MGAEVGDAFEDEIGGEFSCKAILAFCCLIFKLF